MYIGQNSWVQTPLLKRLFFYKSFICINRVKKNDIMDCSFTYLAFFLGCNHANGRVDYEDSWVIKCRFTTKDAHEACQLKRTKVEPIKKVFKHSGSADVFLSLSLSHTKSHPRTQTRTKTHTHLMILKSGKRQQKLF